MNARIYLIVATPIRLGGTCHDRLYSDSDQLDADSRIKHFLAVIAKIAPYRRYRYLRE
jgi:hypothetical protein